jgi:hypothetical protein
MRERYFLLDLVIEGNNFKIDVLGIQDVMKKAV